MAKITDYSESDYVKMRFRVDKVNPDSCDPVKNFPEISRNEIFVSEEFAGQLVDLDIYGNVFTYVVLAYDPNSPFVRFNDNVLKRKRDAAKAAGFNVVEETQKFSEITENIICNRNAIVNRMITEYLRMLKNDDWALLVSYQEMLYSQLEHLREGLEEGEAVNGSNYRNILNNTQTLSKAIKVLENDILEKDTSRDILEALYDTIETDKLDLRPEDIANKIVMKEHPDLFNPYLDDERSVEEFIEEFIDRIGDE